VHKIEQAIQVFLENIEDRTPEELDSFIEEFGDNCKKALRECLLVKRSEEPFSIRMSNIGKPLRQLLLEKLYGRSIMDAQMRLKMTYGYMWESFLVFLLKASGLNLTTNQKISADIEYDEGKRLKVNGSYDIKIDGEIWDVKSASSWSFDNKFVSLATMEADDPFGYVGQGAGYGTADKSRFAGWIVIDKSDGRIKLVETPKGKEYFDWLVRQAQALKDKIKWIMTKPNELPPCEGVVEETFNKKLTGNKHLNATCGFCSYKYKCHPELVYAEESHSKADKKKWKYYLGKPIKPTVGKE